MLSLWVYIPSASSETRTTVSIKVYYPKLKWNYDDKIIIFAKIRNQMKKKHMKTKYDILNTFHKKNLHCSLYVITNGFYVFMC